MAIDEHFIKFNKYKCNKCKNEFFVGKSLTGFCPHCDKNAEKKARYGAAIFE